MTVAVLNGRVQLLAMKAAVGRVCDGMLLREGLWMVMLRALRSRRRPRVTLAGIETRPLIFRLLGIHAGETITGKRWTALLTTKGGGGASNA
jgi:hypothetical protein